jgi:dihydroorotate dehydrogenase (NAD+) catalytic subunit
MVIELVPKHKIGLNLASRILIATGFGGYGDTYRSLVDLSHFGAVITRPVTLRPRRFKPLVTELDHGFLLEDGQHNPGVKQVLRRYGPRWAQLPLPVIVHLPADETNALTRTARALSQNAPLAAIELGLPADAFPDDVFDCVAAIRAGSELPVLVKMPFEATADHTDAADAAGADALVISSPLWGTIYRQGETRAGNLYGTGIHPLVLNKLERLIPSTQLPVVAAGGVHTVSDARAYLAAGATAVQLDSILFINPKQAQEIAQLVGEEAK